MPGWVYVISSKSQPGIVKVGYTGSLDKTPADRADELNHTGNPHGYLADYGIVVDSPESIERLVHKHLNHFHEGKEWFRCSAEDAVAAIQIVAGNSGIKENFYRADRERADQIRLERERETERARKLAEQKRLERKRAVENERKLAEQKKEFERQSAEINARYNKRISDLTPQSNNMWILIVSTIVMLVIIFNQCPKLNIIFALILAGILGTITTTFIAGFLDKKQKSSGDYDIKHRALIVERDKEIELIISHGQPEKISNQPRQEEAAADEVLVAEPLDDLGQRAGRFVRRKWFSVVFILLVVAIIFAIVISQNMQHEQVLINSQPPIATADQSKTQENIFNGATPDATNYRTTTDIESQIKAEKARDNKEAHERRQSDKLAKEAAKKEALEHQSEELVVEGKNSSDEGRYVEAIKKLDRALKINNQNWNAYLFRGVTYYRIKRYSDAIADCSKALSLNGELVGALFYRGLAYQQLKQYNSAVEDYNSAYLMDPEEINVLRQRGLVYQITGHQDWAFSDFELSCKLGSKASCDQLKNYVGFRSNAK